MRGIMVAVLLVGAVVLAGCGQRGKLEMPEGQKSEYPRTYPAPR